METRHRPAARIVCLDAADRLLLLHWQDPSDGSWLWEPPGGGIDPGESPFDTARRELVEETGLDASAVQDRWVPVERDVRWNGKRFVGPEQFFLARFATHRPSLVRTGLLPDEQANLHDHAWVTPAELAALPDRLEPPQLASVVAALTEGTAWNRPADPPADRTTVPLPDGLLALLYKPSQCYLATLMPDGSPQLTQTWVDTDGEHILINSVEGHQKIRNIARDPRVAVTVSDPGQPARYFQIRGRVLGVTREGAAEHIERLAHRYLGGPYPWFGGRDQVRVMVTIAPERVSTTR